MSSGQWAGCVHAKEGAFSTPCEKSQDIVTTTTAAATTYMRCSRVAVVVCTLCFLDFSITPAHATPNFGDAGQVLTVRNGPDRATEEDFEFMAFCGDAKHRISCKAPGTCPEHLVLKVTAPSTSACDGPKCVPVPTMLSYHLMSPFSNTCDEARCASGQPSGYAFGAYNSCVPELAVDGLVSMEFNSARIQLVDVADAAAAGAAAAFYIVLHRLHANGTFALSTGAAYAVLPAGSGSGGCQPPTDTNQTTAACRPRGLFETPLVGVAVALAIAAAVAAFMCFMRSHVEARGRFCIDHDAPNLYFSLTESGIRAEPKRTPDGQAEVPAGSSVATEERVLQ